MDVALAQRYYSRRGEVRAEASRLTECPLSAGLLRQIRDRSLVEPIEHIEYELPGLTNLGGD